MSSNEAPEEYRVIENRKFTGGNVRYVLPCDEDEISRLDFQHNLVRERLQRNFTAPVEELLKSGINVLDVGCGSGRWSLDLAAAYPNSTFTGIDVAGVFPATNISPNVTFRKANTLERLPFQDGQFDYVMQRFLFLAFSPADWEIAMRELTRVTKPGGYLELIEGSCDYEDAPPGYERIYNALRTATLSRGVDIELVKKLETFFANHGFTNVQCNRVTCPIGWDGVVGDMRLKNVGFMMDALRPIILPAMGVSREEYEELTHGLAEQYGKFKTYGIWTIGYGLKPLKA